MTLKELRSFLDALSADGQYPFDEDAPVFVETKFGPLSVEAMFCTANEVYIQALATPIVTALQRPAGSRDDN